MREEDELQPITLSAAAEFLGRPWSTLRDWPSRYKTPRIGQVGRRVYYDMRDLETIAAFKNLGKPVPGYDERVKYREETRCRRSPAA
jgi:hypothetical protein